MSQKEKPTKSRKKTMADVDEPGKSAPAATSKPVIITNRPLLTDPMVVDKDAETGEEKVEKKQLQHSAESTLQPIDKPDQATAEAADKTEPAGSEPAKQPDNPDEAPADETPSSGDGEKNKAKDKEKLEAEAAERAQQAAAVQKLIDSGKYVLPINAVEKRKTKRFMVMGIFLAVLLALVWGDIAADAGIIHISGVKPVTHFFSN